jgi:hypothetical protein
VNDLVAFGRPFLLLSNGFRHEIKNPLVPRARRSSLASSSASCTIAPLVIFSGTKSPIAGRQAGRLARYEGRVVSESDRRLREGLSLDNPPPRTKNVAHAPFGVGAIQNRLTK